MVFLLKRLIFTPPRLVIFLKDVPEALFSFLVGPDDGCRGILVRDERLQRIPQ